MSEVKLYYDKKKEPQLLYYVLARFAICLQAVISTVEYSANSLLVKSFFYVRLCRKILFQVCVFSWCIPMAYPLLLSPHQQFTPLFKYTKH